MARNVENSYVKAWRENVQVYHIINDTYHSHKQLGAQVTIYL